MQKKYLWKNLIIIAVVALSIYLIFPPKKKISLGLDLKGGMHLVMRVKTADAIRAEVNLVAQRLEQHFKDAGIIYKTIGREDERTVKIEGIEATQYDQVDKLLENQYSGWDFSNRGGGVWTLTMPQATANYIEDLACRQSLETIRNRVDQFGVTDPTIQREGVAGGDRILIQLPGVENPERVISLIQSQALLEWKAVTYPPGMTEFNPPDSKEILLQWFGGSIPGDTEIYTQDVITSDGRRVTLYWPLKKVSTIAGSDLKTARRGQNRWGEPAVDFFLTTDAGKRFEQATREYLHKRMAILLDRKIVSAPVIQAVISDSGIIEGGFSIHEAEDLALKLRSGALPAGMEILEQRTVGPSLGVDSIKRGIRAGLIGFAAIIIFITFYYRLSGINAIAALLLNVLILLGAMAYFKATLTLPGIAGLILTIGMAVDANVLIFERIREELRVGKTVKSAVDAGFSRALITIIDTNVTTLIAALFLFQYGTGPVRGFAVTLSIGIVISMFTAVFVSKTIFDHVLSGMQIKKLSI
ncbi:MAG: protein translocase subunit SecD [Acidobacteriota bacterium]